MFQCWSTEAHKHSHWRKDSDTEMNLYFNLQGFLYCAVIGWLIWLTVLVLLVYFRTAPGWRCGRRDGSFCLICASSTTEVSSASLFTLIHSKNTLVLSLRWCSCCSCLCLRINVHGRGPWPSVSVQYDQVAHLHCYLLLLLGVFFK